LPLRLHLGHQYSISYCFLSGEDLTPEAPGRTKGKIKGKSVKRQADFDEEETAAEGLENENIESAMTQKDEGGEDNDDENIDDDDKISNDDEETQLPDDFETRRPNSGVKCTLIYIVLSCHYQSIGCSAVPYLTHLSSMNIVDIYLTHHFCQLEGRGSAHEMLLTR
jgi:hypothetical protein